MGAALRYEFVRITTVRSTWIGLVFCVVAGFGVGLLATIRQTGFDDQGNEITQPVSWWSAFAPIAMIVFVVASVVASQAIGQEYRFGLIRLTLSAFPRRLVVLGAKVVVVVLAAVLLAVTGFVGGWLALAARGMPVPPADQPAPDSTFLVRGVVMVVLWALSAFALAGITHQTAVGIAIPIVSGLIVENALMAFLRERADWLMKVLPWSTATRWQDSAVSMPPDYPFPVGWGAVTVLAVWVVAFLVIETVTFLRRDA